MKPNKIISIIVLLIGILLTILFVIKGSLIDLSIFSSNRAFVQTINIIRNMNFILSFLIVVLLFWISWVLWRKNK